MAGPASAVHNLRVVFHQLLVHDDHDPFASGEWKMIAVVNGKGLELSPGSGLSDVDSGERVNFRDKYIDVTVPEHFTLKIVTYGVDEDGEEVDLPRIDTQVCEVTSTDPETGGQDVNILCIVELAYNVVRGLIELDKNDALGTVSAEHSISDNFGIGLNDRVSGRTGNDRESEGDYTLRLSCD